MYYLSKEDTEKGKILPLSKVVIFKPSSWKQQVQYLEQLIDILVRNTATGEVSLK